MPLSVTRKTLLRLSSSEFDPAATSGSHDNGLARHQFGSMGSPLDSSSRRSIVSRTRRPDGT